MSVDPNRAPLPPQRPAISPRIEYLEHRSAGAAREYRLAVHAADGPVEVCFRIPTEAFVAARVLLQDGPDICFQRLLRMLAEGVTPRPGVVTIDAADLAAYREAHAPAPRRPATPHAPPRRPPARRTGGPQTHPKLPVAAAPAVEPEAARFDEGQRVSHAIFGIGVTMASEGGYTSVQFDEHGPRTFVTAMLELRALSAPHTWEVGPRGKNRPRG